MFNKAWKHNLKHHTKAGRMVMQITCYAGVKMLATGRRMLRWSGGRCSWCGANPGFSSTVSRKGLRCQTLDRDCTDMP